MGRCDQLGVTLVAGLGSSEDFCTLMSGPWQGQLGLAGMVNQSAWGWPLGVVASGLQQMGQHTWGIPAHQSCPCCRGPPQAPVVEMWTPLILGRLSREVQS